MAYIEFEKPTFSVKESSVAMLAAAAFVTLSIHRHQNG